MYKAPSRRKNRTRPAFTKPNLIPILDAVFIFIFFLLMSASFVKIYEIPSDVPILTSTPPSKKKQLALTLAITNSGVNVLTGVPSKRVTFIRKDNEGNYDNESLHRYLINLKKKYKSERGVIIEPQVDLVYDKLVKIMDAARILRQTDEAIYGRSKEGIQERVSVLFDQMIFSNISSIVRTQAK